MAASVPVYRDHEEIFQADTCRPVVDAVTRGTLRLTALVHGHYPGTRLAGSALPGLKTVGYWDAQADQDWGLAYHRNEGVEITLLERGRLEFAVGDREFVLHPGDLTITRPWQLHRVGNHNVTAGRLHFLILDLAVRSPHQTWRWPSWIMLRPADLKELTNILRQNEQPVWKVSGDIVRCFRTLAQALDANQDGSSVSRLTIKINELFVLLLELFRSRKVDLDESLSSSRRTVDLFLAELNRREELLACEWAVEDMAHACRLGLTQFFYHVRTLTNLTPMRYLNNCRLDWAARLLREAPEASVTDISLRCGFSSSQYFATAFSRRFGRCPREFRLAPATLSRGSIDTQVYTDRGT